MAGVNITTTEGSPDADVKIRVRGGGSLSQDNSPLYIVDGFPVSSISDIAPSEIQSIDVLKDASSTAIYGARGANGVIIVTTKSGSEGKTQVNFNASLGWKNNVKEIKVLNPYEFVLYQYETASASNNLNNLGGTNYGNYADYDIWKSRAGHNFQDEVFGRTGTQAIYNANVSGGSKDFKYNVSYAHNQENSIMEKSGYNKDNIGAKLQAKLNKWLTFDFNARMAYQKIKGLSGGADTNDSNAANSTVAQTITFAPIQELVSSDDDEDNSASSRRSPMERLDGTYKLQTRFQQNYNAALTWKPFKHWTGKTEFGYGWKYNDTNQAWTALAVNNSKFGHNGRPQAQFVRDTYKSWRNANTLTYDNNKLFGGRDHLNVLIGHEWSSDMQTTRTSTSVDFPVDFTIDQVLSFTNAAESTLGNEVDIKAKENMLSFFGRVNYTLADKYLMTFTLREDGSSKFGNGNRWGLFPSAALAWRISSEPFMQSAKGWLDDLKLRFSYGTAGNNNIPVGQLVQAYENKATTWVNGIANYWAPSKTMANANLKWETTITRNLGLDFTLFGGKINGNVEAYINTTKDLLIEFPVSGTGYDTQYRNMGKTENKGLEFSITWHAIEKKDWGIDVAGNIGFNKNKVKSLGIMNDFGQDSRWASTEIGQDYWIAVGQPLGQIRGYQLDGNGRYEVSDFTGYDAASKTWTLKEGVTDCSSVIGTIRPGSLKLKDQNGDHVITDEDNTIIGDVNPKAFGGFSINAHAYGFDLSANFNYSIGNKVYNANKIEWTSTGKYQYRNMSTEMADGKRWTNLDPETGLLSNDPNRLAELNANTTMWSPWMNKMVLTDWAIEDASFLRLNTLSLGYTIPKTLTQKVGIQNLRFYVTAYNVFTITGYSGFDPEADCITKTALTPNVDYSGYPRSRTFLVGVNLNF